MKREKVGRYTLHAELGSGGMARVYLASFEGPHGFRKLVAAKRLHPDVARRARGQLLAEAKLASGLSHANIVPTLDVVETRDDVMLVMEYVHGESLGRLIDASREAGEAVPIAICGAILLDILRGLHEAHEHKGPDGAPRGLVHRDVSPDNVIVATDGLARVLDFGVAKAVGSARTTREGLVKGKAAYMAPEQLHARDVTPQADVYSASVVGWELLTQERLFAGDFDAVTEARARSFTAPPPSQLRPEVSLALNRVILRGLARAPENRYQTAFEMACALEEALPRANAHEVAAWVKRFAKTSLDQRDLQRAEAERAGAKHDSRALRIVAFALATLVVVGVGLALSQNARFSAARPKPEAAPANTSLGEAGPDLATQSGVPSASAILSGAASSGQPAPPLSAASVASRPPPEPRPRAANLEDAKVRAAGEKPKAPSCDPPFVLDAAGRKQFKRECL
jgi:serine/threonine-protein kinase